MVNVLDLLKDRDARRFDPRCAMKELAHICHKKVCLTYHVGRSQLAGAIARMLSAELKWPLLPIGTRGTTFTLTDQQYKRLACYDTAVIVDAASTSKMTVRWWCRLDSSLGRCCHLVARLGTNFLATGVGDGQLPVLHTRVLVEGRKGKRLHIDGFQSDLATCPCDARVLFGLQEPCRPDVALSGSKRGDLLVGTEAEHNPVNYRISIFGCPRIPRFPAKNGNHLRQLAKAVESGKIIKIVGKTRVFLGFPGFLKIRVS